MELSPRLLKIASLVPKGCTIADVGTDHGYIPLYLLRKNHITHAIAMDVNPMPLKKAEDNITSAGYGDKCEFRLSDGLEELYPAEADCVVIAGMGGILMQDIISRGKAILSPDTLLILQPMIAPVELRIYLYENGFDIKNEYVVREENKFYNIMCVTLGNHKASSKELIVGKNLKINSPETFDDYISYRIKVCSNIVNGIEKSKNPDKKELRKHQSYLDVLKSIQEEKKHG